MSDLISARPEYLGRLKHDNLLRKLENRRSAQWPEVEIAGKRYINFCNNDYLGMSNHPRVIERVKAELQTYGFGSAGASLLTGRCSLHAELENKIAAFTGFESALLYSSGYLANFGALGPLIRSKDLVFHDRLNHASLIDAVLSTKSDHRRYTHLGLPSIKNVSDSRNQFVITESVFGMDGDKIHTQTLLESCLDKKATLYIDDAHGFGVTGHGRGVASDLSDFGRQLPEVLVMVTLGKALGSCGGMILASREIIEYLIQFSRPFIYDTAPPPVAAAAALEALAILEEDRKLIRQLERNISIFREMASKADIPITNSTTPIQPIVVGESLKALRLEEQLKKNGIYARAIRPPTVPKNTARLRITLSAKHTAIQIKVLVEVLENALFADGHE